MSSYEDKIAAILRAAKIDYQREKTFCDLKSGRFRFDFFLPRLNPPTIIEVDGEQHFKPIYGRQSFLKGQEHDRRKNSYCLSKDIPLYRIPYWEIKNIKTAVNLMQKKFLVESRWHNDKLIVPK